MAEKQTTKTQYYVAASVDGFIADRENGLGWLLQFGMEEFTSDYEEFLAGVGVIVMGSRTYEWLLAEGSAWAYPDHVAWVLTSRELPAFPGGGDIRFATGDVSALHAEWVRVAAGRNVWIVGGGEVAAQVADAGLLDELLLTTMPVVLGAGAPLLPVARLSTDLAASNTVVHPGGAVSTRYAISRG
ncbi:dihydrofolate reductase family protein [Herbiconiux moechotypicola]|uniref:Dihydrofolate reductase family protein n=1 Tax=Herbiconiux moechotypicola TaxID=637393 RepID=A0ABP5Q0R7_9MICO|nr:dihydrofolate reductase family protein [Herbiconiux moechotypicola]MCS5728572.1 dihydrofolate reductase family protein [Herbiconiux moechotypicola]